MMVRITTYCIWQMCEYSLSFAQGSSGGPVTVSLQRLDASHFPCGFQVGVQQSHGGLLLSPLSVTPVNTFVIQAVNFSVCHNPFSRCKILEGTCPI